MRPVSGVDSFRPQLTQSMLFNSTQTRTNTLPALQTSLDSSRRAATQLDTVNGQWGLASGRSWRGLDLQLVSPLRTERQPGSSATPPRTPIARVGHLDPLPQRSSRSSTAPSLSSRSGSLPLSRRSPVVLSGEDDASSTETASSQAFRSEALLSRPHNVDSNNFALQPSFTARLPPEGHSSTTPADLGTSRSQPGTWAGFDGAANLSIVLEQPTLEVSSKDLSQASLEDTLQPVSTEGGAAVHGNGSGRAARSRTASNSSSWASFEHGPLSDSSSSSAAASPFSFYAAALSTAMGSDALSMTDSIPYPPPQDTQAEHSDGVWHSAAPPSSGQYLRAGEADSDPYDSEDDDIQSWVDEFKADGGVAAQLTSRSSRTYGSGSTTSRSVQSYIGGPIAHSIQLALQRRVEEEERPVLLTGRVSVSSWRHELPLERDQVRPPGRAFPPGPAVSMEVQTAEPAQVIIQPPATRLIPRSVVRRTAALQATPPEPGQRAGTRQCTVTAADHIAVRSEGAEGAEAAEQSAFTLLPSYLVELPQGPAETTSQTGAFTQKGDKPRPKEASGAGDSEDGVGRETDTPETRWSVRPDETELLRLAGLVEAAERAADSRQKELLSWLRDQADNVIAVMQHGYRPLEETAAEHNRLMEATAALEAEIQQLEEARVRGLASGISCHVASRD